MSNYRKERKIDIVMCIDSTSSMGPCIDNVRTHAKRFYKDVVDKMENEYDSEVTELRVQVVTFRDLECDVDAITKSEFFELPTDERLFERYLDGITPRGGGDYKESGLEALYTAMTTDWRARGSDDRQVILLFTDADAIDFGEKSNRPGYETICDSDLFYKTWLCMLGNGNKLSPRTKRLIMFAPDSGVYKDLVKTIDRSQLSAVQPQNGMADVDFEDIIKITCASVSSQ
ncbi:MAG: VWA domain-containing protein [Clostridia bacterium]|nr:VWA domain-containing protein [Clostridia bacterium]